MADEEVSKEIDGFETCVKINLTEFTDRKLCGRNDSNRGVRGYGNDSEVSLYATLIWVRMCMKKRWDSQLLSTGHQNQVDFLDSLKMTALSLLEI